jgi:hypothetical protein
MDNDKTEERRARKAAYMKEYRARKKGEKHQYATSKQRYFFSNNTIMQ